MYTTTIENILVPVDFSSSARLALIYAVRAAEKLDAHLNILHVLSPADHDWLELAGAGRAIDEAAKQITDLIRSTLREAGSSLSHTAHVRFEVGDPAGTIRDVARESADVVFMMAHQNPDDGVAARVRRETAVPVLIWNAEQIEGDLSGDISHIDVELSDVEGFTSFLFDSPHRIQYDDKPAQVYV